MVCAAALPTPLDVKHLLSIFSLVSAGGSLLLKCSVTTVHAWWWWGMEILLENWMWQKFYAKKIRRCGMVCSSCLVFFNTNMLYKYNAPPNRSLDIFVTCPFSEVVSLVDSLVYVVFKNELDVLSRKVQWHLEGQNFICCCITSRASLLPAGLMATIKISRGKKKGRKISTAMMIHKVLLKKKTTTTTATTD